MKEIIKINYDSEQPTVLGRDLHKALEVSMNQIIDNEMQQVKKEQ